VAYRIRHFLGQHTSMPGPVTLLLVGMAFVALAFAITWWRAWRADRPPHGTPTPLLLGFGAVSLFFDALGIGNFAPTTAFFRVTRLVRDELIPGTLNVGSALPVAIEAFAFIAAIQVDPTTLLLLVLAAFAGSLVGASVVSRMPVRPIRLGMGKALLVGAFFMAATNLGWFPGGGEAFGFSGTSLIAATSFNFLLGGLNALGIGNFAPSLLVFSFMGLNPRSAFPIVMGSAAYMQAGCGIKFVTTGRFDGRAALGLAIGGIPGVLVGAYVVKSIPLDVIRWLVAAVVLYVAVSMLAAARGREPA
jgi:uncharacterized membrane protein YfcA